MRTETATPGPPSPFARFSAIDSLENPGSVDSHGVSDSRSLPRPDGADLTSPEEAVHPATPCSSERPNIGFIGAGSLGTTLAIALSAAGWKVDALASRTYASASRLARLIPGCRAEKSPQAVVDGCRVVFITVSDDAIAQVSASVNWPEGRGAVHCCGAAGSALLASTQASGVYCGSFHPLQTFTPLPADDDTSTLAAARQRLGGITFAVEGSGWLRQTLESMASDLGSRTIEIAPEDRALYHASAVMSCGAIVGLLRCAAALWQQMGVDQEAAFESLLPLARTTMENAATLGPDAATTGPVARGDVTTVGTHLEALTSSAPDVVPLYVELTKTLMTHSSAFDGRKRSELDRLLADFTTADFRFARESVPAGRSQNDGGPTHG